MENATKLPENAIQTVGLRKVYAPRGAMPAKAALDGIDLAVPRGGIFGLLGPNGAGKSTLINILAGLVNKTAGTARIWDVDIDRDPRASRAAIGIVPQELNIDPFFTPRELLDLQAGLYGVPKSERRTAEILAAVGLADKADAYARTLSGGMRRRLLVAKALVHDIELRQSLWAYVRELNRGGTTVVLTTHYLQEAEELCDRIAIIDRGRLVAHDTKQALLARLDAKELRIVVDCDLGELPARLADMGVARLDARTLQLRYRPSAARIEELLAAVHGSGLGIVDLSTRESDLEDLFLQLVRKSDDRRAGDAA
jgi:ABC-2 type transport system ATP-binding protein